MCGDLLKAPPDLLLIQMTSVCLGKDSILDEQSSLIEPSVINHRKREWEEEAECSDTTLPGYWADELGELAGEWGGFCPHPHPGDLWKGGLRYKKKMPKDKKERLPNAVWLMGLHSSTRHACSWKGISLEEGKRLTFGVCQLCVSNWTGTSHHSDPTAGLPAHTRGDGQEQKGLHQPYLHGLLLFVWPGT